MEYWAKRRSGKGLAPLLALIALFFVLGSAALAQTPGNAIKSIKTVVTADATVIEVEVNSSKPFPVRDDIILLQLGAQTYSLSRSPEDGSLNTLFFKLSPTEWDATTTGDAVTVHFQLYDPKDPNDRWDFGTLDKSLLNK